MLPLAPRDRRFNFIKCINTTAHIIKRERELFSLFTRFSFSFTPLPPPFFSFFICPRRENGNVESKGKEGTKKAVSRCKIYDVQVSARERTNAEPRGVSPVRIAGKSTATRMSPVSILPSVRPSVRSFVSSSLWQWKVVHERARG